MSELGDLFRRAFGPLDISRVRPVDPFVMSLAPVVNGWKQCQNALTGRVFWCDRQGRVRQSSPVVVT